MAKPLSNLQPYLLSVLRIVAGLLFCHHGFQKVFGMFGGMGRGATAELFTLPWFAGVLELAGVLILVGLFTRPVALLLSGEMAVAYFRAHSQRGFWPIQNGGELAALYAFLFLYLSAAGAGPVSLDRFLRRKA